MASPANLWTLEGCVAAPSPGASFSPPGQLPDTTDGTSYIAACSSACASQNATYALIGSADSAPDCTCANGLAGFTQESGSACDTLCGAFPCGGSNGSYSLYMTNFVATLSATASESTVGSSSAVALPSSSSAASVAFTSTVFPASTLPTPSALPIPIPVTPPASSSPGRSVVGSTPSSASNEGSSSIGLVGTIFLCLALLVAFLAVLALLSHTIRRRRRRHASPHLSLKTARGAGSAGGAGAPAVAVPTTHIPVTPNMIYSVVSKYSPSRADEIELRPDQVVAIRRTFKDGWGIGRNVSTGDFGVFPMVALGGGKHPGKVSGPGRREDSLNG